MRPGALAVTSSSLSLTDRYNVVEKLRTGQPLTDKDQTVNQQGLASVVLRLHKQIDAAVAEAYAWPLPYPRPRCWRA